MGGWRRTGVGVAALLVAVVAVPAGGTGSQEQGTRTSNTKVVGHLAPPQDGGFGDVWAHKDVAYLGNIRYGDCSTPNGVWAIDLKDPAKPKALASFAKFPGSDGEDVWVGAIRTKAFKGDLAAVGVQPCRRGEQGFAGLALYDVTNPAKPKELSRLASGVDYGVHEMGIVQRPDGRVLALAAVPYSFNQTQGRVGDLRIVDITDPRRPRQVADWDVRRDGPAGTRGQLAARRDVFDHSAWPFDKGRKLYASFWAAGVQFLDISDPASPRLIGQTPYRPEDGYRSAHSGWFNKDETLFVQNDEVMQALGSGPAASWTFQRVFDTSSLARPRLLSTFGTESAVPGKDGRVATDGIYSVHNAVLDGDLEYVAWYSDGVRVVDLSDPSRPVEVASFVPPPPSAARQTAVAAQGGRRDMPLVWGVTRWKGLVLASDMNSGLWVVRVTLDGPGQPIPAPQATPPKPPPQPDPGGWGTAQWVALACAALALVAAGALARSVLKRRTP
jgi:hypothetical protein